ncbi:hypothetical protein [Haemophilus sputorum]|uniref:hypothetical protein n=1 Tax=Haemophilus sputorum TaxID=1078480 RepID=UPI000248A0F8|nr:hypothetical protein [Haemophilus sputorum]
MNLSKILMNILDAVDVLKNGIKKPNDEPITLSIKGFRRLSFGMKFIVILGIFLLLLSVLYFGYGLFISMFSNDTINFSS